MTSGIIEILIENSNVKTLVGVDGRGHYKVYPVQAPEQVENARAAYILVSEVSLTPSLSKGCPSTMDRPRYNVLVYSTDFLEAETIQEACRVALDNGQGWTTQTVNFDAIYMVDRQDLWSPGTGQGNGMYVKLGVYEAISKRTIT